MKIIILHGDNTVESYKRLKKFIEVAKSRNWEILRVSELNQNLTEIVSSQSLFGKERLIIAEDTNSLSPNDIKWLSKKGLNFKETAVFYSSTTISATKLKMFPKESNIEEFKIPVLLWKFLDSFYPKNVKTSLKLLHQVVERQPIEFVFSLLAKQVRDLYWTKVEADTLPYPSWRIRKLKGQSQKFTRYQLEKMISDFAEIDIKAKTSKGNLIDLLDFTIVTNLE